MALRHIIFALIFGVAIGTAMYYALGGQLIVHVLVACAAALAAAWFTTRNPGKR